MENKTEFSEVIELTQQNAMYKRAVNELILYCGKPNNLFLEYSDDNINWLNLKIKELHDKIKELQDNVHEKMLADFTDEEVSKESFMRVARTCRHSIERDEHGIIKPNTKQELKVGDVVCLKSGGVMMTIAQLDCGSLHTIRCNWFAGERIEEGWFVPETLVLCEGC